MAIDKHRKWIALAILVAGGVAVALVGDGRHGTARQAKAPHADEATPAPHAAKRAKARGPAVASRHAPGTKPAARAPQGELILRASWGSAPGELGRRERGAPEGPMSFAVDDAGRVHVLDQVNARIQVFEKGKDPEVVSLPTDTYQDLALAPDGSTVVMDALGTGTVGFVDPSGKMTHSIPIAGPSIEDPAAVTAMFTREDGTWLEVEHQQVVRVADARGEPDPDRPVMPGRFSADGAAALRVAIAGPTSALLTIEHLGSDAPATETPIAFDESLFAIRSLDSDRDGRTYVVVDQLLEDEQDPDTIVDERQTVVVVGKDGKEERRFDVELAPTPDEQKRPVTVDAHGAVYQLLCGENAAMIERFAR